MIEGFQQFIHTPDRRRCLGSIPQAGPYERFGVCTGVRRMAAGVARNGRILEGDGPRQPPHQALHRTSAGRHLDGSGIGPTVRAITVLSLIPMHGSLDQFLDRMTAAISEQAAARLEKRDD